MEELVNLLLQLKAHREPERRLREATRLLIELDAAVLEVGKIRNDCLRTLEADLTAEQPSVRAHGERVELVMNWVQRKKISRFTTREAFAALPRSAFPIVTVAQDAIDTLESTGYIKREQAPPPSPRGGRPPSPRYTVTE